MGFAFFFHKKIITKKFSKNLFSTFSGEQSRSLCTLFEDIKANGTTTYTDKGTPISTPNAALYPKVFKLVLETAKALGIGAGNRPATSKDEVIDDDGLSEFIN